jgi:glycosyltransferase involved in cell wall biosynthesis
MPTGVATYSVRVVEYTRDSIAWTVRYPRGGDPSSLPGDVQAVQLKDGEVVDGSPRFFMLGNSPDCFEVAMALERSGGAAVMHEVVMHHMLRYCLLAGGRLEDYRRELLFEYGPSARRVERLLSRRTSEVEYDMLLKRFPLTGRLLHSSSAVICLNQAAAGILGARVPGRPVHVVSHPLSPLPAPLPEIERPGGRFVVGMAGGGHPGRNAGVFLQAADMLRRRLGDVRAVFAGGGWGRDLPPWASCTGRLAEPEYQATLRTMDAAADIRYPDCAETSGSLLELMRAGIPCVTAATGSFVHLPSDTVVRIPAPPSAVACAGALEMILVDPAMRERISGRCSAWASSQGSPERARSEWTAMVSSMQPAPGTVWRDGGSLSAAWHETPPGFRRVTASAAVSWQFSGRAVIELPAGPGSLLVTAWGDGSVSGTRLPSAPGVIEVARGRLEFEGRGFVTQICRTGPA